MVRNNLGDKLMHLIHALEVATAPQEQCLLNPGFKVSMTALDGPVLMRFAPIVSGRFHAIILDQRLIPLPVIPGVYNCI